MVKNPPDKAGGARNAGSIPGWESFPGGGNGNPLQYSCLENSMYRGAWRAIDYGVADMTEHAQPQPLSGVLQALLV